MTKKRNAKTKPHSIDPNKKRKAKNKSKRVYK